jgi:exonuclease III
MFAELEIDILNLQETELNPNMNLDVMCIRGYSLETEQNDEKVRTATYKRKDFDYKRRKDLEMKNGHMIVIDLGPGMNMRIINIYRPFSPKIATEKQFFELQLEAIESAITSKTMIMGDFNIDLNKEHDQNYHHKRYAGDLTRFRNEQNLTQVVMDDT